MIYGCEFFPEDNSSKCCCHDNTPNLAAAFGNVCALSVGTGSGSRGRKLL